MIEFKTGDILCEDAEALVNTVNCVGFMGRGIALQFKKAWPENFKAYEAACRRKDVQPGRMFVFETERLSNPKYIVNFPTKRHWRGKSKIEDIESGLAALVEEIRQRSIRSIAVPALGAGLGGLEWKVVRERIVRALGELEGVHVTVFEPTAPRERGRLAATVPEMTPGRAVLVSLMDRYLRGLLDTSISLLEVHKLLYFMQEAGEPLKLRLVKGPYGPYAENLRHVLNAIEGHFVSGYGEGGDDPTKPLELIPGAIEDATAALEQATVTRDRFERVAGLVNGFESPFGLELLATVHWVTTREGARSDDEATNATYAWSERKRRFSPEQIRLARQVLSERGFDAADVATRGVSPSGPTEPKA